MAGTLDRVIEDIRDPERSTHERLQERRIWPMIVLRTPGGMAPKK
jgi:phosphoketolase